MSNKGAIVLLLAACYSPSLALAEQPPEQRQTVKMINSASIALKVNVFSIVDSKEIERTLTVKAGEVVLIGGNPSRAEICTKGHGCSSTSLSSGGTYNITRSEKENKWIIVKVSEAVPES